jgi:hypothetical protein
VSAAGDHPRDSPQASPSRDHLRPANSHARTSMSAYRPSVRTQSLAEYVGRADAQGLIKFLERPGRR